MKKLLIWQKIALTIIISAILLSCEIDENSSRLLVKSSGKPGEIILLMDSVQWQGSLGDVMRKTLHDDLPGVSRPESLFTVRYIEPTLFNSVLNKASNIIFVATMDSKTEGGKTVRNFLTKNYIQDNPDRFIVSQKDIYASGQEVLYLFSNTEEELVERISNNKDLIQDFFNNKENERLLYSLYVSKEEKSVSNYMTKKYGYSLRVPNGYRIEADDSAFFWIRSVGEIDKNIFVTYRDYTDDMIFENHNLIGLRDSITLNNIFEDPENPETYTKVDTMNIETEFITTKLYGQYAKRIRGIWQSNTKTLGGSFISYIFVDKETNRLYYLDGFVVSPGKSKREPLRELDVILKTFKTPDKKQTDNNT
ncbi:MAG: DUF4837 family protein [Bacteroidota bacterium]